MKSKPVPKRPAWQDEVNAWARRDRDRFSGWKERVKTLVDEGLHPKAAEYLAWDEAKD